MPRASSAHAAGVVRFAQVDCGAIFDDIEADNPRAAIAVDQRIRTQIKTLAKFPEGGCLGRIEGTPKLVIQRTPYIAA